VLGGLIDVNANGVSLIVDIQKNSFLNFSGISIRAVRQFNVETVCFWKIFDFDGLYLLSGKVL
jgi:hypothetical protein